MPPLTEYGNDGQAVAEPSTAAAQAYILDLEAARERIAQDVEFRNHRALQGHEPDIVVQIPLRDLRESPTNPRRTYTEKGLAELAASVKTSGVLSPVQVRPVRLEIDPLVIGHYEIVFGHRRFRAATRAELETVPCRVREITDAECAQWQATENLQREDLTALDEAEGFAAYIQAHGISKDALAEKLGVSRTHVYNRLKLAALVPAAAQALRDGKIKAEVATLIARVPEKHQAKALEIAREGGNWGEPKAFRKVRDELKEKFTLTLKDAIFSRTDENLVPLAGACVTCPKRSGCTPELYQDLIDREALASHWRADAKGSADICTDPDCFEAKKKAHLKIEASKLEAAGAVVVQGSAARAAVGADGTVKGAYMSLKEWKSDAAALKKVGKAPAVEVKPITIQDPRTGKTVLAVKIADVKAAGVEVKDPGERQRNNAAAAGAEARKQQAQREAQAEELTQQHIDLLRRVHTAASAAPRTAHDLQLIARAVWDGLGYQRRELVAEFYGHKEQDNLAVLIGQMGASDLGLFALTCAMSNHLLVKGYELYADRVSRPEALLQAAKAYGVEIPERWQPKEPKPKKERAAPAATPIEQAAAEPPDAAQEPSA